MTASQKQELFMMAAERLKLASHFAESQMRGGTIRNENISTMLQLTAAAHDAMKKLSQSINGIPPK